jgi:phage terminase small subunit
MGRSLTLTQNEIKFVWAYLANGCNAYRACLDIGYDHTTAQSVSYKIPRRPLVKQYIQEKLMEIERDAKRRREDVLNHLEHGMKVSLPLAEEKIDSRNILAGIACIQEINKMDGNYAVTKTEPVEVNLAVKEVVETAAKYDKPY